MSRDKLFIMVVGSIALIIVGLMVWAIHDENKNGPYLTVEYCLAAGNDPRTIPMLTVTETRRGIFGTKVTDYTFQIQHCNTKGN